MNENKTEYLTKGIGLVKVKNEVFGYDYLDIQIESGNYDIDALVSKKLTRKY